MKYYTLLAFFLVLGICRTHAQTVDGEPKKLFPNRETEYQGLKAKEKKANATDPNSKLDAAAKRQQLLGATPPSAMKRTRKLNAAAKRPAGSTPSDASSAELEKAHAAKTALQPKNVKPVIEQENAAGNKPTNTPKH